ncbi:MAG: hypothetical protein IJ748_00400 [Bacteroidales bacterium]|nr:hypothetical protein [Bacteroidales bacterium]
MKKSFVISFLLVLGSVLPVFSQEIQQSCTIIETSVKDNLYYNFTLSGDGFLSYNWGADNDNQTTISVDLSKITISKDYSLNSPKVWLNCINGTSCIEEAGRMGAREGMYFNYSKTYLPANNDDDMEAMFMHLNYLIKIATGKY